MPSDTSQEHTIHKPATERQPVKRKITNSHTDTQTLTQKKRKSETDAHRAMLGKEERKEWLKIGRRHNTLK